MSETKTWRLAETLLTAKQLRVVKLRVQEDKTWAAIAQAEGVSEQAVKGRWNAARRKLAGALEEAA